MIGTAQVETSGLAKNPRAVPIEEPIGVTVMCFDASGVPLVEGGTLVEAPNDELSPGEAVSFTATMNVGRADWPADTYEGISDCPIYLVAGSGLDPKAKSRK